MGLLFQTDMAYTELANKIYDVIEDKLPHDFTHQDTKEISADIAVYCEDIVSGIHLFETFSRLYSRMFNHDLPFYDDADSSSEQYKLNALRFVVWHSIMCQNPNVLINPLNQGVRMIAEGVLELLDDRITDLPSNNGLTEYLYSEETQSDPIEVKKVLIWLMYESYLGRWAFHDSQEDSLRKILGKGPSDRMIDYVDRSLCAFQSRAWPLSLKPQRIYAEMIRIDMEDDNDELAQAIESMSSSPLGLFHIVGCDDHSMTVQDYKNQSYTVALGSFDHSPMSHINKYHHTDVIASFITLDGKLWHTNGICSFANLKDDDFETYCKTQQENQETAERRKHQYDDIIENHKGNRLFFFDGKNAYSLWLKNDLGLKNVDDFDMSMLPEEVPLTAFIEPTGNMTIGFHPEGIKHPDNKLYDQLEAREVALQVFIEMDGCSPALAQYLISNNLLPNAMINDAQGMERGKTLLQENIEFFARCIRRDIDSDEPFSTRKGTRIEDTTVNLSGKISYDELIDRILDLDGFISKTGKSWYAIDSSETITIVEDEHGNEFTIPTREIYEAHLHLSITDITNKNVEPYITKKMNVPAATAILFNVVGEGLLMRNLREAMNKFRNNPS